MKSLQERVQVEAQWHEEVEWEKRTDLIYGLPFEHKPLIFSRHIAGEGICGKKLIEIGCGAGDNVLEFAKMGGDQIFGIDISSRAINQCKNNLKQYSSVPNVEKISLVVGDVHKLDFQDESVDVFYGNAILHHLDLSVALKEINRCLKKNGKAIFCEPLGHNIFINLFRLLTPSRRTPTERPLTDRDFKLLSQYFIVEQRHFYFLSVVAFAFGILGLKSLFGVIFKSLFTLEEKLGLNKIFSKYCWMVVLTLRKK